MAPTILVRKIDIMNGFPSDLQKRKMAKNSEQESKCMLNYLEVSTVYHVVLWKKSENESVFML